MHALSQEVSMNRTGMPLVVLFGYPSGSDQLIFLGRRDEIVLTLSTEIRATVLKFLGFCNGMRSLDEIRELMPDVEELVFDAVVSTCESQNIIYDSREVFSLFHEDSANPLRFGRSLVPKEVTALVESRSRDFPSASSISLVRPDSKLLQSLSIRKSAYGFEDEKIPVEIFGGLLASMYSLSGARPVPSAGKLYSLDLYVFVRSEKQAIPRGLYRYNPENLSIHNLGLNVTDTQLNRILDSYQAEETSFVFFIAADLEKVSAKYANRGYRYALIETGHVAQNAYLYCTENQLGIREFGGFQDKLTADFLGLNYPNKAVLTVLLVGKESSTPSVDLGSIASQLKEELVGPEKPLEWVHHRPLEFEGDSFHKVAAVSKFRTAGSMGELESHVNDVSFGLSVSSQEASIKAMAEGLERHASSLMHVDARKKAESLDAKFFDPRIATPFSSKQVATLRLQPFEPSKEWEWVIGEKWLSKEKVYVPVDHVFYPINSRLDRLLCYRANSSGVAAHFDIEEAKRRALYELIERDAISVTWHSQRQVMEIPSECLGPYAQTRTKYWKEKGWKLMFLDISLDSIPVVLVVIYSKQRYPAFVSGAAAHHLQTVAAQKALDEAETMLILALGEHDKKEVNPRDVRSPMDHGRLYFNQKNLANIEWLLTPRGYLESVTLEIPDVVTMFDPTVLDLTPVKSDSLLKVFRILSEKLLPIHFGYGTEHYGHDRFNVLGLKWKHESQFFPHFFA